MYQISNNFLSKKIITIIISASILFALSSCNTRDQKIETIEDLNKHYDGVEFKNCDEFLTAADNIIDFFVITVEKASNGDQKALEDIESIDTFMGQFDEQSKKFEDECPEKFLEFQKQAEVKMEKAMQELMDILFGQYDMDKEFEPEELNLIDEDLEQTEELN